MDINSINQFVKYCNTYLPIKIGVICHTYMSDGQVLEVNGDKVFLNHYNKGYEQWWRLKDIKSAETNLSRYGINKCLEMYINSNNETRK